MLLNLEHLGLAVQDLAAATALYTKLLGVAPYKTEHVASEAVDTVFFRVGGSKIELLAATSPDSAIARYLEFERPRTSSRCVCVRHVAPVDAPVGPGIVRRAMREAYERCGSTHTRVHVLRHTLARRVLASGGTLKEVADLLRHRSLDTSQIYAKVDTSSLSQVALPWPGSTS